MLYVIKNVSRSNIVIGKDVLHPQEEIKISDLEPLKKLIESKLIEVTIYKAPHEFVPLEVRALELSRKEFIDDSIKPKLMESFFNYYLSKNISPQDVSLLKWFYKNVGFTNNISKETLSLLDNVKNYEELTTVLLNNIYPELLEHYLIKEDREKNK